jgi:hypothetical protein
MLLKNLMAGIQKTTYELLMTIILLAVPYQKNFQGIWGDPCVVNGLMHLYLQNDRVIIVGDLWIWAHDPML